MRPVALVLMVCLCAPGCGGGDVPKEKSFGGRPVEHWLEALKGRDPNARRKAAEVLGNVGPIDPRAVPALIGAVKDRDARVRDAAVLSLSKIGPPAASAEAALQEAAKDDDPAVRSHAAAALSRVRGAE